MNLDPERGSSNCSEVLGHLCCARDLTNLLCSHEEGSLRSFDRITKRKVLILLTIIITIFLLLYWPIHVDQSDVFDEVTLRSASDPRKPKTAEKEDGWETGSAQRLLGAQSPLGPASFHGGWGLQQQPNLDSFVLSPTSHDLVAQVLAPLVWYSGRLAYILVTLARLQDS
eukprot:scaffold748_cov251-Pinguiococcus_pyrenoidosus.AAC.65